MRQTILRKNKQFRAKFIREWGSGSSQDTLCDSSKVHAMSEQAHGSLAKKGGVQTCVQSYIRVFDSFTPMWWWLLFSDFCTLFVCCIIFFKYLCFWSRRYFWGVPTRERDVDAASPKMSPSFKEVISEVVSPIESRWQVRIGPA